MQIYTTSPTCTEEAKTKKGRVMSDWGHHTKKSSTRFTVSPRSLGAKFKHIGKHTLQAIIVFT
jgi:hypothetical protein